MIFGPTEEEPVRAQPRRLPGAPRSALPMDGWAGGASLGDLPAWPRSLEAQPPTPEHQLGAQSFP